MTNPEASLSFRLTFSQLRSILICRTQFYNIVSHVEPTGNVFASSRERILASYKLKALEHVTRRAPSILLEFSQARRQLMQALTKRV